MKSLRIVFMGTPEFALHTLLAIASSKHRIVAVYTMPPRPSGRGYRESYSPVYVNAQQFGLPLYTPPNFRNPDDIAALCALNPDVVVVAAYGVILPKAVLEIPKYGCINVHPSKLPRWRGAAPIQRTILAGDSKTSVCIMQMDEGMDTGDILMQRELEVSDSITTPELYDIAGKEGAQMMVEVLDKIDALNPVKQSSEGVTIAHKISKEDARLDFTKNARLVHAQIRAMTPRPAGFFVLNGEMIKIIAAGYDEKIDARLYKPGEVIDDMMTIACGRGVIKPITLQREGRKMIYLDAFLRGFPIPKGTILC